MVDPQQRLLLEMTHESLMSYRLAAAGSDATASAGMDGAGVFVGISNPDYADLKKLHTPIGVYSATGGLCGLRVGNPGGLLGLRGVQVGCWGTDRAGWGGLCML